LDVAGETGIKRHDLGLARVELLDRGEADCVSKREWLIFYKKQGLQGVLQPSGPEFSHRIDCVGQRDLGALAACDRVLSILQLGDGQ